MSVSLWAYEPDKCDGGPCIGECDLCNKKYEDIAVLPPVRETEDKDEICRQVYLFMDYAKKNR